MRYSIDLTVLEKSNSIRLTVTKPDGMTSQMTLAGVGEGAVQKALDRAVDLIETSRQNFVKGSIY